MSQSCISFEEMQISKQNYIPLGIVQKALQGGGVQAF